MLKMPFDHLAWQKKNDGCQNFPHRPYHKVSQIESLEFLKYGRYILKLSSTEQSYVGHTNSNNVSTTTIVTPLKAMLFIDGTWLYYSLHHRREDDCPIIRKFGKGWQHKYKFDWAALPRIICEQMQMQQTNQVSTVKFFLILKYIFFIFSMLDLIARMYIY